MGELKPLGSEKLNADEKLKRILELTYYKSTSDSKKSSVVVEQTSTGVYGIIKEKDGYYVKKGLNESSLDYIGGLFMKNRNRFSSYAEALKKLEFLTEQEKLQEATKYVLKSKTPKAEAPMPQPTNDIPPPPEAAPEPSPEEAMPDMGGEEPTDELGGDETSEPGLEDDYLKVIQKLTGKLGEKLRSFEDKLESDDIKYVLNMVISAVNLDNLEETDKEEILDKFDPEEETSDEALPSDEVPGDETSAPAPAEDDLGEEEGMKKLEELIGTSFFDDDGAAFDDDDDDDISTLDFDDKTASKYAQKDMENEYPDDVESLEKDDDEMFNDIWRKMKNPSDDDESMEEELDDPFGEEETFMNDEVPIPDEELGATAPIPDEEEDKTVELDIDELTNMVNTSVKETLSNYFNK